MDMDTTEETMPEMDQGGTATEETPETVQAPTAEQMEQPVTEGQAGTNLSVGDLQLMHQILQVMPTRGGAVRPEEMETVGGLYTRLTTFLREMNLIDDMGRPVPIQPQTQPEVGGDEG